MEDDRIIATFLVWFDALRDDDDDDDDASAFIGAVRAISTKIRIDRGFRRYRFVVESFIVICFLFFMIYNCSLLIAHCALRSGW